MAGKGGLWRAKDSVRPSTRQFVVMSATKTDSAFDSWKNHA